MSGSSDQKKLVMDKLEREELEGELVKFKILYAHAYLCTLNSWLTFSLHHPTAPPLFSYAELMHQKEDDSHRMSMQIARAARASNPR